MQNRKWPFGSHVCNILMVKRRPTKMIISNNVTTFICIVFGKMTFANKNKRDALAWPRRQQKTSNTETEWRKRGCPPHSNVFIYLFEHFVFLLDGIYRNQHWYTCWYIFTVLPIAGSHNTVSSRVPDCNVKHTHRHARILAEATDSTTVTSNGGQQTHACDSSIGVDTKWKRITVGWPNRVCHPSKLFKCTYKVISSHGFSPHRIRLWMLVRAFLCVQTFNASYMTLHIPTKRRRKRSTLTKTEQNKTTAQLNYSHTLRNRSTAAHNPI